MPYHRKATRLPQPYYRGPRCHFITICCDLRRPHLRGASIAGAIRDLLLTVATRQHFVIHAYCVMPDHLHFLAQGTKSSCELQEFVRNFKSRSAYAFRQITGQRLWEKSYYDHILRDAESLESVASYIWWNPVRRRLCESPRQYPYSGSQTMPM